MNKAEMIAFYAAGIVKQMEAAGWEKHEALDAGRVRLEAATDATFLNFRHLNREGEDGYEYGVITMHHATGEARVMGGPNFTTSARDILNNIARTHLLPAGTQGVLTA